MDNKTKFYKIMQYLNLTEIPMWTISTIDKAPINSKLALKYQFDPNKCNKYLADQGTVGYWGSLATAENSLVSLTDLYNEPNTPQNNVALKADIHQNKTLFIDVESIYDKSFNPYLKALKAEYAEWSKSRGIHIIIKIPDSILNDEQYKRLFKRTTIKIATTSDPHSGIELFFNNHFMTFTRNMIKTTIVDDSQKEQGLRKLLDYAVTQLQEFDVNNESLFDDSDIPTDALIIKNHALQPNQLKHLNKKINDEYKNLSDDSATKNTYSEIEYRCLCSIAKAIVYSMNQNYKYSPFYPDELLDQNSPYDKEILVWVLYLFAQEFLEPRDKWNERIHNITKLQYTCQKAFNFAWQTSAKFT